MAFAHAKVVEIVFSVVAGTLIAELLRASGRSKSKVEGMPLSDAEDDEVVEILGDLLGAEDDEELEAIEEFVAGRVEGDQQATRLEKLERRLGYALGQRDALVAEAKRGKARGMPHEYLRAIRSRAAQHASAARALKETIQAAQGE